MPTCDLQIEILLDEDPATDEQFIQLMTLDKHTTIEGKVAERFTRSRLVVPVLAGDLSQFSWWFHSDLWGEYKASALSETNPRDWRLQPIHEHVIAKAVLSAVEELRLVFFRNGFGAHKVTADKIIKEVRSLTRHGMKAKANPSLHDAKRHGIAAKKLAQWGLIRQTGIQRLFANFYAPEAAMWDLDDIGIYRGHVVAFDYKHKFPDRDRKLGANGAISRLYKHLQGSNILVIYITLDKPDRDPGRSAVELLDVPEPTWYACNARIFSEDGVAVQNRNGTAFDGTTPEASSALGLRRFACIKSDQDFRAFLDHCIDSEFPP